MVGLGAARRLPPFFIGASPFFSRAPRYFIGARRFPMDGSPFEGRAPPFFGRAPRYFIGARRFPMDGSPFEGRAPPFFARAPCYFIGARHSLAGDSPFKGHASPFFIGASRYFIRALRFCGKALRFTHARSRRTRTPCDHAFSGSSQPYLSGVLPLNSPKNSSWMRPVTGPGLPAPTGLPSTERIGVISAAVPHVHSDNG